MQTKYNPSANIIRDSNRTINYIPTPNSERAVKQVVNDFRKGQRAFNIIGSYGTGKSSFLWAFSQSLTARKKIFDIELVSPAKVEIINFVGDYKSIITAFAEQFEVKSKRDINENIFAEIFNRYYELSKKSALMIILIDEFGKFLEYAALNEPEKELYFIQQLAEFVNNPEHNIVLITTVHQNFDAYAFALNNSQKQEWTKVKGRFREITFNEPVEQLLFLASEHLKAKERNAETRAEIKKSVKILKQSKAFKVNQAYVDDVATKLFPLDLVAANILTLLLQKYGQNERSLFSFLESTDHTGLKSYDNSSNPFYNSSNVYDYLIFNFYPHINSRYNPDFSAWASIKTTLEIVEKLPSRSVAVFSKIVKTVGLLNITASGGAEIGREFLIAYSETCLGIRNAKAFISDLESHKIIQFRSYNKRFVLSEGTDLDIPLALIEAGSRLTEINDIATRLNKHFDFPNVLAKASSYRKGTPRLFEFKVSAYPISETPVDEIDGFINLIFNENLSVEHIIEESTNQEDAILFAYYSNSKAIKNQLFEIEKTLRVLDENNHDRAAVRELDQILFHQKNLLNHYILYNLYNPNDELIWIYNGEIINIENKKHLNRFLSEICDNIYPSAPIFKNELINKHKISSSAHSAKRNYFRALVDGWDKPDLGFDKQKFPPEKTIYLTLLKENGIKLYSDEKDHVSRVSRKSSFTPLWNYSMGFLESAKDNKKTLAEFVEPLTKKPFKLKQGLIDFWLGSFLFIKKDDFALFGESGFIPYITDEVLELVVKYPHHYQIKTFNIDGVKLDIFNKYRVFLNQQSKNKIGTQSFIETIKPFLTFYKGLPAYSQGTSRLSKEGLAIRNAIATSKDPEKSFFEEFPRALGYDLTSLKSSGTKLSDYSVKLQDAIREIRSSYDELLNRFEEFIVTEYIGKKSAFPEYKNMLQGRFKKLKKHLCLPYQKVFIQRVDSEIPDKKPWLNSLASALTGKSMESFNDEDEVILMEKFTQIMIELDTLTALSKEEVDHETEDIIDVQLSSFIDGINRSSIRLPKIKQKEVAKIEEHVKSKLSRDKALNITALAHILKDLLKK